MNKQVHAPKTVFFLRNRLRVNGYHTIILRLSFQHGGGNNNGSCGVGDWEQNSIAKDP